MALAVMSECLGHHTGTPRRKKIKSIHYLVFSTFPCRSSMEKGKRGLINDSRKRLKKTTKVSASDAGIYRPDRADQLGNDSNQFAIGFDLSAIPEAVQFVARQNELTK